MLILIGYYIVSFCLTFLIGMGVVNAWRRRRERRHADEIANKSIDDLFRDASVWPQYWYDYNNYRHCMKEETAKKIVVQRYLVDRGLIGYRKESIEL